MAPKKDVFQKMVKIEAPDKTIAALVDDQFATPPTKTPYVNVLHLSNPELLRAWPTIHNGTYSKMNAKPIDAIIGQPMASDPMFNNQFHELHVVLSMAEM